MNRKMLYLVLCILGAVLPYALLIPWLFDNGLDIPLLFSQITASRMALYGWLDAVIAGLALIAWILVEQRRRKVRLFWLPVAGTILVGGSFGLPLYLYLRELQSSPR